MQQTSAGVDAPRVHIITDSASDLVQGELEGISAVVPLSIAFGDEEYLDGVDLSHHRFYEKLVESDELPRTSPRSCRARTRARLPRRRRGEAACAWWIPRT